MSALIIPNTNVSIITTNSIFNIGKLQISKMTYGLVSTEDILIAIWNHINGVRDDINEKEKATNDLTAKCGGCIISVHTTSEGIKFKVATSIEQGLTSVILV